MGERKEIKPPNIQSWRMMDNMCTIIGKKSEGRVKGEVDSPFVYPWWVCIQISYAGIYLEDCTK